MKKIAGVLIIGLAFIALGTSFPALGGPPGPPPGPPPHGWALFGGPPGPPPGGPPHGGGFLAGPPGPPPLGGTSAGLWAAPPDLIEKLKLTDDQLKRMRLIFVDFQNRTRKTRTALMGLHDEKKTMLISGKVDQAELAKCDEGITKLATELMGNHLKLEREQLAALTPEQVEGLAVLPGKMHFGHGPKVKGK